jgi:hypothetical protein
MDLAFFIRNRLRQLRLSSRDRARAAGHAESYIASFHTASNRTDLHDELERVLQLPQGYLARLADRQRRELRLKTPLEPGPITLLHRRLGHRTDHPGDRDPDGRALVDVHSG